MQRGEFALSRLQIRRGSAVQSRCDLMRPLLLFLSWFVAVPVSGQSVSGRLLDESNDEPVAGAEIALLASDGGVIVKVVSGDDGRFSLSAPEASEYTLQASRIGYATSVSAPITLAASEHVQVEFRISQDAVVLPPLAVIVRSRTGGRDPYLARKGYYERKSSYGKESGMGFATFLEGEDLRATASRVSDLLQQVSGMSVQVAGGNSIVVKGRRGCRSVFYLDGVYFGAEMNGAVPASAVIAIEVYPGSVVPMEYMRGRWPCGVVAVWTGIRQ